jgi:hypothetical protein
VLIGPLPLDAHGSADLARQERGIGGGIVYAEAAVRARGLYPNQMNPLGGHAHHGGDVLACSVRPLRARPQRQRLALEVGDRAGWSHHAVTVHGKMECGLDDLRGIPQGRCEVSDFAFGLVLDDRAVADDIVNVVQSIAVRGRPDGLDTVSRRQRRLLGLGDEADEIVDDDDLDQSRYGLAGLDRNEPRAHGRRQDDRAVNHPVHCHVVHKFEVAAHLGGNIDTSNRLADDLEVAALLQRLLADDVGG